MRKIWILMMIIGLWASAANRSDSTLVRRAELPQVDWARSGTSLAIRVGLRVGLVNVLKNNVHEWRPNYHNRHAFPSRHAVWAYSVGAQLTHMFGMHSPWWSFGAQTVANAIGFQRVMDKQHWPGDVLAGAGLGVGIDLISYGVTNAIFGRYRGFPEWNNTVNDNGKMLSVSTGASLPLRTGWGEYRIGTGLYTNYRFSLPTSQRWGMTLDASLATSPIKLWGRCQRMLNAIGVLGGPYWHCNLGESPFAIGAVGQVGYQGYLTPKNISVDNSTWIYRAGVNSSVTLTKHLALGVEAGFTGASLKLEGVRHSLNSITASMYSVVKF